MPARTPGGQDPTRSRDRRAGVVGVVGLLDAWLPALPGVPGKLELGATVADVGGGAGGSPILLGRASPGSRFGGFDPAPAAIATAGWQATAGGVADRIRFEVADPGSYPGTSFDLVCQFDRLRAVPDPLAVARHVLATLAPDGSWLLVAAAGDEAWVREVAACAGFSRFRVVGHTRGDLVLEGKP